MNMVSTIRARVNSFGIATINPEEYDQLQREWITRCCPDDIKPEVKGLEEDIKALMGEVERLRTGIEEVVNVRLKGYDDRQYGKKELKELLDD